MWKGIWKDVKDMVNNNLLFVSMHSWFSACLISTNKIGFNL